MQLHLCDDVSLAWVLECLLDCANQAWCHELEFRPRFSCPLSKDVNTHLSVVYEVSLSSEFFSRVLVEILLYSPFLKFFSMKIFYIKGESETHFMHGIVTPQYSWGLGPRTLLGYKNLHILMSLIYSCLVFVYNLRILPYALNHL